MVCRWQGLTVWMTSPSRSTECLTNTAPTRSSGVSTTTPPTATTSTTCTQTWSSSTTSGGMPLSAWHFRPSEFNNLVDEPLQRKSGPKFLSSIEKNNNLFKTTPFKKIYKMFLLLKCFGPKKSQPSYLIVAFYILQHYWHFYEYVYERLICILQMMGGASGFHHTWLK